MPVDIGPKIGIDGEKEFRQELNNINQQLRTLGSEMKAVTSAFDDQDQSVEKLVAQNAVLAREIGTQEQALARLRQGLIQSTAKYGEMDSRTQKWQQAVNNATTNLNKLKSQLSANEKAMDQASNSSQELEDSMEKAGDAAESSRNKFSAATVAIGNLASSAIQSAISAIGDLVGSFLNLDESTEEFRVAQGRLNTAFENAGYGADAAKQAYSDFYGILGDTDRATEASQLLAQLADSEKDLSTWTEIAAGINGTFGDSLPIEGLIEAANETAKVGQVTGTLADALNWVGISEDEFNLKLAAASSESERNRLIMETLAGAYDEASEAFQRNNETLLQSRNAQVQMDTALAGLGQTIAGIKNQIDGELTPALANVATAFSNVLSGTPTGGTQLGLAIAELIETVAAGLPEFAAAGGQILSAIGSGIVQAIPALTESATTIMSDFVGYLAEAAPQMVESGLEMLQNLTEGLVEGIPELVAALPEVIQGILDYITENLPVILETGTEILRNIVEGIVGAIPELVEALPEIIISITQFLRKNLPQIVRSGGELIGSLISGILEGIPDLLAALPELTGAIILGLSEGLAGVVDIGANLIRGLWEGISDMAGWIADKIQGFGDGVLNALKDFFGIQSPSRVMRDQVGVMIARGLALGLEKGQPKVEKAAADIGKALENEIAKSNEIIARMKQEEIQRQAAQEQAEREQALQEMYQELSEAELDERQDILDRIAQQQAEWDAEQVEAARDSEREAAEARLEELEDFQDKYLSELKEIQDSQEDMASQLRDYGNLFETADGVLELGDLREQINQIKIYGDLLQGLKARGVSDSLLEEVTSMDVEDAVSYTKELMSMTDEQYGEYMALWEEKQREAQRVAEQFYSSELDALNEEYVQQIPETLSDLKDELVTIGQDSALGLADGFESMASRIKDAFVGTLQNALQAAKDSMGIHSPSTVWRDEVGRYLAQGIGQGFEDEMSRVAGQMQRSVPSPTIETVQSAAAGMVNGMAAVNQGVSFPREIVLKLENGREIARWLLPDLRSVERSDPEVVTA